ncbi:MAG: type II secretion system F family protein [Bacteroidales bacterium]|nr:type II secretion system F family protein [Bacteroidales bacterium]
MADISFTVRHKDKPRQKKSMRVDVLKKILNMEVALPFGSGIKNKGKSAFYKDMSTLINSGVDLVSTLKLILDGVKDKALRKAIEQVYQNLINGNSLSHSFSLTGLFSGFEIAAVNVGEESGQLGKVMTELAAYYQKREQNRKKVTGLLSYPIFVMFTAFAAVVFMLSFVVPMFQDVFLRLDKQLPGLTLLVIKVSGIISHCYGAFLLVLLAAFFLFLKYRNHKRVKLFFQENTLKLPYIGPLILNLHMARFCMALELLLSSKVPLVRTLSLSREMINFFPLVLAIEQIEADITSGARFRDAAAKHPIFDSRFLALMRVAEEVNKIDEMAGVLKQQYTDEVEHQASVLMGILEPLIILLIGVFVGVILVAMYMPVFQMGSALE